MKVYYQLVLDRINKRYFILNGIPSLVNVIDTGVAVTLLSILKKRKKQKTGVSKIKTFFNNPTIKMFKIIKNKYKYL